MRARAAAVAGLIVAALVASLLTAATAQAVTKRKVSLSASATVVNVNQRVTLTGTVSPRAKGVRVYVQAVGSDGKWANVASTRTTTGGKYKAYTSSSSAGVVKLRVYVPATRGYTRAYSRTVYVSNYRWIYLRDMDTVAGGIGDPFVGQVRVNGGTYLNSVYYDAKKYARTFGWDLGRSCREFRGTLGLRDDAETATRISAIENLDGTDVLKSELVLGQSQDLAQDVTGILRMTWTFQDIGDDWRGDWAIGDARVYCAF